METTPLNRRVLLVAILAAFVAFLDGSIVTVALPAITDELGGGLPVQQWVVDAYLITLGALILLAGSLSDLLGRIAVLRIGLIGFAITSIACGLAPTAELLIVARAAQGAAGALLVPSSLALIMASHRGESQARAIGLWTAWTSAAFIVGPVVGGLLTDLVSWRWVFLINVLPIAATMLLMAPLRNEPAVVKVPLDLVGAALGAVGLGGVVFGLIEQANYGWGSPLVIIPLVVGGLSLFGFIVRQATAQHPMMPLALFRQRNFAVGNLATVAIYASLSLSTLVIVLFLQQIAGLSATQSGLTMLPVTIMLIVFSSLFGRLAGRYGSRWFMTAGPLVAAGGLVSMLAIDEPFDFVSQALVGVVALGLGLAITVAPLTSAVLGAIDPARSGIASAVNNAVSRISGLVAIALLGAVVGTTVNPEWLDRALVLCASLMVVGGVISAIGIRRPGVATR
ncbi:MAG: DHA2 family efflux MFS transporter permease subunit [Microcella sp.]|uniref:DHA2 family efflux MFS transporter permease subunit n=1 Tax=Microcella sp. TaxID=1913979 RepID=UPI0024CB8E03|nr:DHA2 family efflux MFS transporter permease subunit [Microcella sp.]UYN84593.1 MAG: DHA2 family efflux MFS transporter permease subunit [Microcella sp.]